MSEDEYCEAMSKITIYAVVILFLLFVTSIVL